MITEGSLTSTKPWHALRDAPIDEERLRCSNPPGIRSALGKEPKLGVDKGSGGDRVPQSLLQWNWDGHNQGRNVYGS